ncbi:hypothetical protein BH20GEM2_BH20GEM2_01700 [soil metagenome]|jgi:uncharacterized repeat protein (TIGR04138 family)
MSQEVLCEATIDALRSRHPAYHETAYLFVLSGLHHTIDRLREPRHISGRELAEGCRDLALERYGPLARSVLAFWGIRSTRDLGQVVFALVDCGILVKQPHDDVSDFEEIFDFDDLDHRYPWTIPSPLAP